MTGAGGGAFLVAILEHRTEVWARLLLYLAPSLSLALTAGLTWLLNQFDEYLELIREMRPYYDARRAARQIQRDKSSTVAMREDASKLIEEAVQYRLRFLRDRLTVRSARLPAGRASASPAASEVRP